MFFSAFFISFLLIFTESSPRLCPVGKYPDLEKRLCLPCDFGCLQCENQANNCTRCHNNFFQAQQHPLKYSCLKTCDLDEFRIKGRMYYNCTKLDNSFEKKCGIGSYLSLQNTCKLCHEKCETCSGPLETDCTNCKKDEFKISRKIIELTFQCSKICQNIKTKIKDKNYFYCSLNTIEEDAEPKLVINKFETLNLFTVDWLHVACFILLGTLVVIVAIFIIICLREKKKQLPLYSVRKELIQTGTENDSDNELKIITLDKINFENNKKLLGKGAFGNVFKCIITNDDGSIVYAAVKIINPTYKNADIAAERIRIFKELQSMLIPSHPYVIRLLGINMADDLMLIMPLRLGDLKRYLADSKDPIPVNRLARYCAQIADGMMHLHGHNVFHCDLKAGNVLVKDEFHIEISDFGLACPSIADKYRGGTFTHMALELFLKLQGFTAECDVWAYGVTVWEIYTLGKEKPYEAQESNRQKILEFLQSGGRLMKPNLLLSEAWPNVLQCFSKSPLTRPKFVTLYSAFTKLANNKIAINDETLLV